MADLKRVAGAAVFTAFVAAATMAVNAYIAATGGYFNVGEVMVYKRRFSWDRTSAPSLAELAP